VRGRDKEDKRIRKIEGERREIVGGGKGGTASFFDPLSLRHLQSRTARSFSGKHGGYQRFLYVQLLFRLIRRESGSSLPKGHVSVANRIVPLGCSLVLERLSRSVLSRNDETRESGIRRIVLETRSGSRKIACRIGTVKKEIPKSEL